MEAGGRPVGGSSAGQEEREQFGVFCTGNQCFARGWYKSRVKEGSSWKHGRISAVTAVDRLSSRRLLALQLKAGSRFPPAAPVRTRRGADGCSGVMLGPQGPPRGRRRQAEPQQKGRPRRPSPTARRERQLVLTVHSPASGSFTCSEEARTETLQPPPRPGSRSAGGDRRGAACRPQPRLPRPHLHGGRQPEEGGHEEVAEPPQPPRRPTTRHGRRRHRHRLRRGGTRPRGWGGAGGAGPAGAGYRGREVAAGAPGWSVWCVPSYWVFFRED